MVEKRNEEQKLVQAPIIVMLGGKEYSIKPLVIRDSREWRRKVTDAFAKLPQYLNVTTDNPEAFSNALKSLLVDMPEIVSDLFFSYAKEIDRETIEATATDAELANAFQEIMAFAFPLSQALTGVLTGATRQ